MPHAFSGEAAPTTHTCYADMAFRHGVQEMYVIKRQEKLANVRLHELQAAPRATTIYLLLIAGWR